MSKIVEEFGDRIAEGITPQEIDGWLESHEEWMVATKNRYLALVKLTYRLAEENGKIKANPARLLHMRKENNARVRYLNQYEPLPTNLDYLESCKDEESRLRSLIQVKYPFHMRELDIALHTGMRRGEQYRTDWADVNFERRMLTVPRSKHGEKRHIPLNAAAMAAFTVLRNRATSNFVFLNMRGEDTLRSNRHWFEGAVAEAGIRDFTWHDLRHTFASRLIMVGVDLRTVQELMGHKTIHMTCRYAHLAPAHQLAAVERLLSFSSAADMLTEEMSSGKKKSRNGNKTGDVSTHREIPNSSNSPLSYSLAEARTILDPRPPILQQSTDTSTDTEAKARWRPSEMLFGKSFDTC